MNTIFRLPHKVAEERGVNCDIGVNELKKIAKKSKQVVLMYDPSQQIRPGDITSEQFNNITHKFKCYYIPTEYRINIPKKVVSIKKLIQAKTILKELKVS